MRERVEVFFRWEFDIGAAARTELGAGPLCGKADGAEFQFLRFRDEDAAFLAWRSGHPFSAALLAVAAQRHIQSAFAVRRRVGMEFYPRTRPEEQRGHNHDEKSEKALVEFAGGHQQKIEERMEQ